MGMAASQARLLCITARIHDVEYQAQAIQAAKVQLATQSDQAYTEYMEALDATTLTLSVIDPITAQKSTVAATYNNLCSKNKLVAQNGTTYMLRNADGLMLVDEDVAQAYNSGECSDAYEFALYMMNEPTGDLQAMYIPGVKDLSSIVSESEENVYQSLNESKRAELQALHEKLEGLVHPSNGIIDIYDSPTVNQEDRAEYEATMAEYKELLYYRYSGQINEQIFIDNNVPVSVTSSNFDVSQFNYYVGIYNQIAACGGCESITEYGANAGNDSEWLHNMVQSGLISISTVTNPSLASSMKMTTTSPSSDVNLSYDLVTNIDKTKEAKLEAEYEHKLKQIDKKDKQFDLDLSKLETERSALTTEYDSVKKVVEDNVKRTFGIFS